MNRNRKRVSRNGAAVLLSIFGLMGFNNNIDSRVDAMNSGQDFIDINEYDDNDNDNDNNFCLFSNDDNSNNNNKVFANPFAKEFGGNNNNNALTPFDNMPESEFGTEKFGESGGKNNFPNSAGNISVNKLVTVGLGQSNNNEINVSSNINNTKDNLKKDNDGKGNNDGEDNDNNKWSTGKKVGLITIAIFAAAAVITGAILLYKRIFGKKNTQTRGLPAKNLNQSSKLNNSLNSSNNFSQKSANLVK